MKKIFLIAETPRAGNLGHRFLIAPEIPYNADQISSCCSQASKQTEGKDYLAASQDVEQRLPNGAIRQGKELIILCGIQTAKLNSQEKTALKKELEKLLPLLQDLVEKQIDWQKEKESLFLKRQELLVWEKKKLPTLNQLQTKQQRRRIRIALCSALIGIFIVALFLYWLR